MKPRYAVACCHDPQAYRASGGSAGWFLHPGRYDRFEYAQFDARYLTMFQAPHIPPARVIDLRSDPEPPPPEYKLRNRKRVKNARRKLAKNMP